MNILIKYHERTSDENQMFLLDISKHYQIIPIQDNIDNYTFISTYNPPTPKVDLSKYNGRMVYGTFEGYGRINDNHSIFMIDTIQIDRDLKIEEIIK